MYSLKYHSSIIMNITVPLKPETVVHTCNLSTQETEAGRSEVGVIFGYIDSQGPAWATQNLSHSQRYNLHLFFA